MGAVYTALAVVFAPMLAFSPREVRRHTHRVKEVHETVGVPLTYFSLLEACEFAGALGLVAGIWSPALGVAVAIGLVLYFRGGHHLALGWAT